MAHRAGSVVLARKLGRRIRALREEAGITQEQLAWDCDLAKSHLSQVGAGRGLPSLAVIGLLAKRLNVAFAIAATGSGTSCPRAVRVILSFATSAHSGAQSSVT